MPVSNSRSVSSSSPKKSSLRPAIKARGNDVEDRSAHREFAGVDGGVGALIALAAQQRDQAFMADFHAGLDQPHRFANAKRGQHALEQGIGRRDEKLRAAALGLQPVQRGQPLAR